MRTFFKKLSLWHWLLLLALLRLAYLPWFCHVTDLAADESYYWDWGRHLDWGYYSKPPLIGWLTALVGWLSHHQEWAIRLTSLLCGTLSLIFLTLLAKRLFGEPTARWALLLLALSPANFALNLFLTIDAPLMLFWSAALWSFWHIIEKPQASSPWPWLLLTLSLGLGILSKQMMLVFPAIMLLCCALNPTARPLLRCPVFWLCLITSLSFLLPVLWWNHQNGWITLQHTREHFQSDESASWLKHLGETLLFPLIQAGMLSPLSWLLTITVLITSTPRWKQLSLQHRYLILFSAPGLLVFFALSLRQSINPNWPAVFYPCAIILLASFLANPSTLYLPKLQAWLTRLARPTVITAIAVSLFAALSPLLIDLAQQSGSRIDPVRRLRGWHAAGQQAQAFLDQAPRPQQTVLLALGHRDNASQFAFYTPSHPTVYRWQPDGRIASQYELWPSILTESDSDVLILHPSEKKLPNSLSQLFQSTILLGRIEASAGHHQTRQWQVWLGHHLQPFKSPQHKARPATSSTSDISVGHQPLTTLHQEP